jgi:hypothetical protein
METWVKMCNTDRHEAAYLVVLRKLACCILPSYCDSDNLVQAIENRSLPC